ncbi:MULTISPECIES: alpha/beta hydrolase [unclassified Variovorax]|uniref:alpha/beta hydrolase n=1 Tax=unclassified Variovorax TaxID=663243 RepID=UPI000D12631F|nr:MULTISPECIES: alpha/beta hydrolase [unclassified Variovorax]AVQ83684.1 alpha/beta hydrolase [Variovorax sp. PMC12]
MTIGTGPIRRWCGKLALCALPLLLAGCVQSMFYYPDNVRYETPDVLGMRYEPVQFTSADGTRLSGWFLPAADRKNPKEAKGTVVHFHGNAQNMSTHWRFVAWLPKQDYNVLVFDYRGYGQSEGKPEPKGVFEDSNAALNYVRSRQDVDPERLFVFGQSLGGTNAIAVVGSGNRAGVKAAAIESTFYSYSSIANDKFKGAGLLVSDDYAASKYVAAVSPIPLLFIHGTADQVIPVEHSKRLLADAREPKRLIEVQGAGHLEPMTTLRFGNAYRKALTAFFESSMQPLQQ